jgi:protein tyrosine phosphatase (PTP) superfamily phosphohydrolase (DUF442 family)
MKIFSGNENNHYNSGKKTLKHYSPVAFEGIVRPSKLINTKGSIPKKIHVFWIDIKRNYSVYDFENSGKIKSNFLLKKPVLGKLFDFFELKLKNFHKVSDKYHRGGIITCEYDILRLKRKGITDIISLIESSKFNQNLADFAKKQEMNYHHIELHPPYGIPKEHQIGQFFDIIHKSKGGIYVHCLHGKDRTGLMTFLYEIEVLKTKSDKAIKNMINFGLHVKNNVPMIEFLAQRYPALSKKFQSLI